MTSKKVTHTLIQKLLILNYIVGSRPRKKRFPSAENAGRVIAFSPKWNRFFNQSFAN